MRRPRWQLWTLMVAVAVIGVATAVAERSLRFRRIAAHHANLSREGARYLGLRTWHAKTLPAYELTAKGWWHSKMADKYEWASRHPFLPVLADPSKPDFD
jgi:hypothetical protein